MELIAAEPTTPAATWAGEPTIAPSAGELITTSVAPDEGVAGGVGVVVPVELPVPLPELEVDPGVVLPVVAPGVEVLLPVPGVLPDARLFAKLPVDAL